jgi:hypothetical protein
MDAPLPPAAYATGGPKGLHVCTFAGFMCLAAQSCACGHGVACVAVCARVRQQLCFRVNARLGRTRRLAWKGRVTQTVLTSLDPANPSLELRAQPSVAHRIAEELRAAEPRCTHGGFSLRALVQTRLRTNMCG